MTRRNDAQHACKSSSSKTLFRIGYCLSSLGLLSSSLAYSQSLANAQTIVPVEADAAPDNQQVARAVTATKPQPAKAAVAPPEVVQQPEAAPPQPLQVPAATIAPAPKPVTASLPIAPLPVKSAAVAPVKSARPAATSRRAADLLPTPAKAGNIAPDKVVITERDTPAPQAAVTPKAGGARLGATPPPPTITPKVADTGVQATQKSTAPAVDQAASASKVVATPVEQPVGDRVKPLQTTVKAGKSRQTPSRLNKSILKPTQGKSSTAAKPASQVPVKAIPQPQAPTATAQRRTIPVVRANLNARRVMTKPATPSVRVGPVSLSRDGIKFNATAVKPYFNRKLHLPTIPGIEKVQMIFPVAVPAPITSAFGWRIHPISKAQRLHTGTDIGAPMGTPVMAALPGRVILADNMGGYGISVAIEHDNGIRQTLYAHMSELFVRPGDVVPQGTVIGRVGSTGASTGPHLHFELRQMLPDGTWVAQDASPNLNYSKAQLIQSLRLAQQPQPKTAQALTKTPKLPSVLNLPRIFSLPQISQSRTNTPAR